MLSPPGAGASALRADSRRVLAPVLPHQEAPESRSHSPACCLLPSAHSHSHSLFPVPFPTSPPSSCLFSSSPHQFHQRLSATALAAPWSFTWHAAHTDHPPEPVISSPPPPSSSRRGKLDSSYRVPALSDPITPPLQGGKRGQVPRASW